MADPKNDDPVVTTKTAKKGAAADEGLESVSLTSPQGTKVTAPKRSVERLKRMGFK